MATDSCDLTLLRHCDDSSSWEAALAPPDPRLRGIVAGSYQGWHERAAGSVRRREVPIPAVPLILNLGPAFRVTSPADSGDVLRPYRSFLAGMTALPALTEAGRHSLCLQVNLTPLGAYRVLGMAMHHLTDRVVELEDLFGPAADRLLDRLHATNHWSRRFRLLDQALLARVAANRPPTPDIAHAVARLQASGGTLPIGTLAAELDCSRRRLIDRFHHQVGLAPKVLARVLRFYRATALLGSTVEQDLADLALACGYYDQAHFNREFRALAGCTPRAFLREQAPQPALNHL